MKEKTFMADCPICSKPQEFVGIKNKKEVYLCGSECRVKFNERQLKLQRKNTVLPKWLFNKGVIDNFPNIHFRESDKKVLIHMKKRLKNAPKKEREDLKFTIKHLEDVLKFPNSMYRAEDVEKALRDILNKYELVDKSRIIRTRPQDIGKKRYTCESCNKNYWDRTKPEQCSKCKSKRI